MPSGGGGGGGGDGGFNFGQPAPGGDGGEQPFLQEFLALMRGIWVLGTNTLLFLLFADFLHRWDTVASGACDLQRVRMARRSSPVVRRSCAGRWTGSSKRSCLSWWAHRSKLWNALSASSSR